ncbi:MAG: FAD-binding oxidoreductase [Myxococcales bacterium]|nr:FAD-binding oxidoreductase [Myxococcales bacterium]
MSTRSHWGWGYADRFPALSDRRDMADAVAALLEVDPPTPGEPVPLSDVVVRPPRVAIPRALEHIATQEREARARHTYGRAYPDLLRGFHGDFSGAPDVVGLPQSEADIAALVQWAMSERVAVVPWGGGTSVTGGVEGLVGSGWNGVMALDLAGLNAVLDVDHESLSVRVQAGCKGPALEAALAPHGLTLRHFPQSFEFSTVGGWVATRAGGHFATLYTHIDDLVQSVRMWTPAGVWDSRRLPGSGAGPSPDRLAIGSEGALGVITEAWLRVRPRPRFRAAASVHFADFASGVAAARAVSQSGLYPANCRLLDPGEALLNGVAMDGSSVLLLAFESADHALDPWIERALAIAKAQGGTCPDGVRIRNDGVTVARDDAAGSWRQAFFDAPYMQNVMVSIGVLADTFETACTWADFPNLDAAVRRGVQRALDEHCGGGRVSCRFTHVYPDGPAPYYTWLALGDPPRALEQWQHVKRAASDALLAHGATITHHHAVGRTHMPWYVQQRPAPFGAALAAAKRAVDPEGVLNPGVLVPDRYSDDS